MLIRQLDNWVRRAVDASRVEVVECGAAQESYQGRERRQGQDRRQGLERRKDSRFGAVAEAKGRRSKADRRATQSQANAIN